MTEVSLKPQVLYHFGEHFWCPSRWQDQKFNFQVILIDFLDGQDPFTKSGGHARSLRPKVWNFALVWPIHRPYENTGSTSNLPHARSAWKQLKKDSMQIAELRTLSSWYHDHYLRMSRTMACFLNLSLSKECMS